MKRLKIIIFLALLSLTAKGQLTELFNIPLRDIEQIPWEVKSGGPGLVVPSRYISLMGGFVTIPYKGIKEGSQFDILNRISEDINSANAAQFIDIKDITGVKIDNPTESEGVIYLYIIPFWYIMGMINNSGDFRIYNYANTSYGYISQQSSQTNEIFSDPMRERHGLTYEIVDNKVVFNVMRSFSNISGNTYKIAQVTASGVEVIPESPSVVMTTSTLKTSFSAVSCTSGQYVLVNTTTGAVVSNTCNVTMVFTKSAKDNWTKTIIYKNATGSNKSESITYYDGLGKPVQQIAIAAGTNDKDIVQHIEYDMMGRSDSVSYLPFASEVGNNGSFVDNAANKQKAYYQAKYAGDPDADYAYSKSETTSSSSSLIAKVHPVGENGHINPVKQETSLNSFQDRIKKYTIADDGVSLEYSGYYLSGIITIQKTSKPTLPEALQTETYTYTNSLGQKIAEETRIGTDRRITYYVYDDMGRQRYVIPAIQDDLITTAATITLDNLRKYCYYYEYDEYGKVIKQYSPGAEPVYTLYDKCGRVAMTQDGTMRLSDQWHYTKYDIYDRPVNTGLITGGTFESHRAALEAQTVFHEERLPNRVQGYTRYTYPTMVTNGILTTIFYDDYDWVSTSHAFSAADALDPAVETNSVMGLMTGIKKRVLGIDEPKWLMTVNYYNSKYQTIQSISGLYPAGIEVVSNLHNFVGEVVQAKVKQIVGGQTYEYNKWFNYDNQGRLSSIDQQIAGDVRVTIASYTYDDLGRASTKSIHNGKETTTYTYDVPGRKIAENSPSFSYKLWFDKAPAGLAGRPDGNLSHMTWGSNAAGDQKGYSYSYDGFGQMTDARFLDRAGAAWAVTPKFAEQGISYDKNGNILTLNRTNSAGANMHQLEYHYMSADNGNAMTSVKLNGVNSGNFLYDQNGNMTKDGRNGIQIDYNILNLPEKVYKNNEEIKYIYDASGTKLATVAANGSLTYYRSVFTYAKASENSAEQLLYIMHPEGLVAPSTNKWIYKYFKTDHTGSTRVLLTVDSNTLMTYQTTDFYPFGSVHGVMNSLNHNRYLYGGKEYQDAMINGSHLALYDFHARFYNPLYGRWFNQDPAGQLMNPYLYCGNSPMMYVDPDGEFIHLIIGAVIGGIVNMTANWNNINGNFWRAIGYFGIGAGAGALGAGVGAGISSAMVSGGSFSAGFIGSAAAKTVATSFISGAAIGGGAGFSSGFTTGFGNALLGGQSVGQALSQGGLYGLMGGASGSILGGITSGIDSVIGGRRFWDGATVQDNIVVDRGFAYVRQNADMNCGPASSESMSRGQFTQNDVRNTLGGDPNTIPLPEDGLWNDFSTRTGRTYNGPYEAHKYSIQDVSNYMKFNGDVAISLKGDIGHTVIANRVTERTITKISGKIVGKMFLDVMDPSRGQYIRISNGVFRNSHINMLMY